jgi:hypothetical protein
VHCAGADNTLEERETKRLIMAGAAEIEDEVRDDYTQRKASLPLSASRMISYYVEGCTMG